MKSSKSSAKYLTVLNEAEIHATKRIDLPGLTVARQHSGLLPLVPYSEIKRAVLGKRYQLSVSFVDTKTAVRLHMEYKKLAGPVNILSFPFDKESGEIVMHLGTVRKNARQFGHTYPEHLCYLLIHGMLHLLGHVHGSHMDSQERVFLQRFCPRLREKI